MADVHVRPGPKELLARMGAGRIYEEASHKKVTLSRYLESIDPSDRYKAGETGAGLDAFERVLQAAGIITRSDPSSGIYANEFGAFMQDENLRALVPEWVARIQRRVFYGGFNTRAGYEHGDAPLGDTLNQFVFAGAPRVEQIQPQIPLSEIIATTTEITSNSYKSLHLDDQPEEQRFARVGQMAELPRVKLLLNDQDVTLYKFGRAIEISYEALRRLPIDLVALHVQRVAVQMEVDKVTAAIDILVSGDGNAGTAATETEIATLDPAATTDVPTLRAWQAFKLLFEQPYMMTVALTTAAVGLELLLLNSGSANIPLAFLPPSQFGQFTPINPQLADGVRLGITPDAPTGKVIGIDRRFSLEHIVEIGSDISENMRWVHRQVELITMSEVSGFAIMDQRAARILDTITP